MNTLLSILNGSNDQREGTNRASNGVFRSSFLIYKESSGSLRGQGFTPSSPELTSGKVNPVLENKVGKRYKIYERGGE